MPNIYFLSIRKPYAEMIASGFKQWEFRQNPNFGAKLAVGDRLFIVSATESEKIVNCLCTVTQILRNEQVKEHFGDYASGHWKEAGCADNTDRDWDFFVKVILNTYPCAIKLQAKPLPEPVDLEHVVHATRGKSWKGIGLTPLTDIGKYSVAGTPAIAYFTKLVDGIR